VKSEQIGRSFPEICEDVEGQLGRKISAQKKEFALRYVECGGNQTEAARRTSSKSKNPQVRGNQMYQDEGVQALIDAVTADVFDISTLTPEVVLKLLLKEYGDAKYTRDRKSILELLGKHLGMFRDQHDYRHLHVHKTDTEFFTGVVTRFGREAAFKAGADLGYSKDEITRLITNSEAPESAP